MKKYWPPRMVGGVARIFSPEYWFALGLLLEPEDEAGLVSAARPAGEARVARQRGAVAGHHRDGGPVTIWK